MHITEKNDNNSNNSLLKKCQFIEDRIYKYLDDFSGRERKFKKFVCIFRILIFFFAMGNTIILGIKFNPEFTNQVNIGLILSAIITFLTTIAAFFNFEQYWMKNRVIVIELRKIRDNFSFEVINDKMDDDRLKFYLNELNKIQDQSISYWEDSMSKLKQKA